LDILLRFEGRKVKNVLNDRSSAGGACSMIALNVLPGWLLVKHMALHILLMNAAAPVAALLLTRTARARLCARWLVPATFLQIAVLWGWHAPSMLKWALADTMTHLIMQLSLYVAAMFFWLVLLSQEATERWRSILALLVTSKLYCLLGALLVFAPETIFPGIHESHVYELAAASAIMDQQAAGLLMLVICPLTYISAGVVMAAQWLQHLSAMHIDSWPARATSSSALGG
jgi:putative membrane protein